MMTCLTIGRGGWHEASGAGRKDEPRKVGGLVSEESRVSGSCKRKEAEEGTGEL